MSDEERTEVATKLRGFEAWTAARHAQENRADGFPDFHDRQQEVCGEPAACQRRGWCWRFWTGTSPLPREYRRSLLA